MINVRTFVARRRPPKSSNHQKSLCWNAAPSSKRCHTTVTTLRIGFKTDGRAIFSSNFCSFAKPEKGSIEEQIQQTKNLWRRSYKIFQELSKYIKFCALNAPSINFNFNFQYFIEHLKFKRMGLKALKLIESLLPRKLTECTSNYEYQSSRSHKNWSGSTHGRSYSVPSSPLLWQRSSHMAVLLEAMLCIDRDKEHGGT